MLLGGAAVLFAQADSVPAGTDITVRTNQTIDLKDASDGRIYTGVVDRDVLDSSGRVAIPRGSNAELVVRNINSSERAVDLESITVGGNRYVVAATGADNAVTTEKEGVGKNKRTAKYVGGGAVIGSIIGAIAGGGKGAAIGAIAGGAAGAGAQTITRGRDIHVPAESLLTFRLDRPLMLSHSGDNGYSRNGRHYHRYQY
ncbi:MAG TPA: hypothetical protein VFA28_08335 [Bryobacteraceae bacterium]|jgi:hypothetical protein|nr:hypothetical protein [Bryobacteraceae bacterium]